MLLETSKLEVPKECDEEDENASLYILQPRTYTPQLPSPQPSPRIFKEPPRLERETYRPESEAYTLERETYKPERESNRLESETYTLESETYTLEKETYKPERGTNRPESETYTLERETYKPERGTYKPDRETRRSRPESSASSVESAEQLTLEVATPRIEQVVARPRLRVVEIGARADPRVTPRLSHRPEFPPKSGPDPAQAPELVIPQDPEVYSPQRTSLRQRVSLKTNPPGSIQVPPPNAMELQRPSHVPPRIYQAPDSAYGSDMERPPVHSMASINSSLLDFSPPFIHPSMIPSPHSERQFFRPVQASPYSPLQQRPHTAGTIGPHHFPAPPRNTPSAMGMSIMSSGTAMTNKSGGGKTVKKKRSAFGWLKKAFALDEEERAAFEQKKQEQMANPYYEAKSQQFLDGKRIRPRPGY